MKIRTIDHILLKKLDSIPNRQFTRKFGKRADSVWNTFFHPLYDSIDLFHRVLKEEIIKNEITKS